MASLKLAFPGMCDSLCQEAFIPAMRKTAMLRLCVCESHHRTGPSTELDVLSKASLNDFVTDSRMFTECAQGPPDGQD